MAKILVVDDERIMLKIASKILSAEHEIICAGSGAEAIELFLREKPDLVLTDLIMPGIDGYELQSILQEKSAGAVPIMFMTADESDEAESKGFALGAGKIQGLTEAANLDLMTGLSNKIAAQKELSKLCATSQGVLMLLDLDNFKLVNDLHGHAMGDKILIRFAELIRGMIRSTDLAGRIGGDEFIVFCQNVHDEKIIFNKALFLNHQLIITAKNLMGADMNIPLGTSVGAVFVPNEGRDFSKLMEKADKALYKVKQHGKHGCAFFGEANFSEAEHKNISQTQMILSERSRESGAYFVDFEKFKAIYQFEARLQTHMNFLELTLETDNDEAREDFLELLIKNLRRSDCVTRYGRDQFLIILTDTPPDNVAFVRRKILAAWQAKNLGGEITFEAGKVF